MDNSNFGMFFSDGNKGIKSKETDSNNAPWISQLKSVFNRVDKTVVIPYARNNGLTFNYNGEKIDEVARIYFIADSERYEIYGLAKGVGNKEHAFSRTGIPELKKNHPGKVFEVTKQEEMGPFIKLVKANGDASCQEINEFVDFCNSLLCKLGIQERIKEIT